MLKKFKRMKLCRKDVEVDGRQVKVPYSSWLGFSRGTLQVGDFFQYREPDGQLRFARMHFRVARDWGNWENVGHIVAQVADQNLQHTSERWVDPKDVVSTVPAEHCKEHIRAFFENQVELNGY